MTALASAQEGGSGSQQVLDQINRLKIENLSVILIFGTGFVAALLWGLGTVVRAFREDVGSATELRTQMAALEQRVSVLEQAVGGYVAAGDQRGHAG
jgi:hypothetical protein